MVCQEPIHLRLLQLVQLTQHAVFARSHLLLDLCQLVLLDNGQCSLLLRGFVATTHSVGLLSPLFISGPWARPRVRHRHGGDSHGAN